MKPKQEINDVLLEVLALLSRGVPAQTVTAILDMAEAKPSNSASAAPALPEEFHRGSAIEDQWWTTQDADRRWIASQELEGQWPDIGDNEEER